MAFTGSSVCFSFLAEMWQAVHNFSSNGDVFKLALYTPDATLSANTSVYSSTNEISAAGYTAGGAVLPTTLGVASGGPISFPQFLPVVFGVTITARGGLIYNHTKGDRAVCVLDFGMSLTSNNFTVTPPANGPESALLRVAGTLGSWT